MKTLNHSATATFIRILSLMKGKDHLKLDNAPGAFMPLSVEFLFFRKFGSAIGKVYSFAHYFEQNGDLVPDPDMTFLFIDPPAGTPSTIELTRIYPLTFQTQIGFDEAMFQNDHGKWQYKPSSLADLVSFSNLWMKNIKLQQEI